MLFAAPFTFLTAVGLALLAGMVNAELVGRNGGYPGGTSDTCGQVNSPLKVPTPHQPGRYTVVGNINACICHSGLPNFVTTDPIAISGVALAGSPFVTSAIEDLLGSCEGHQTCYYPTNSVPTCKNGNPCYFDCKNGFVPYPSNHPTQCTCPKPYTQCNGQCGIFHGCPSAHPHKRDEIIGHRQFECRTGLSACGIFGRGPKAWECVDTQHDLESCGGCVMPLAGDLFGTIGRDCTALPGVSDVSCIGGKCVVHRCNPGYELLASGSRCEYMEDNDPIKLAIQYGLADAL